MNAICNFYRSSIGKKVVMAVTGLMLIGFVVGHMAGNLKTFASVNPATGKHKLDEYAELLREIGAPFFGHETLLWGARIGLLLAVALHIVTAIQLAGMKKAARSVNYSRHTYGVSSFASRYMYVGGLIVAFFIVFHILHFTTGTLHFQGFEEGKVYANVVKSFQVPWIVAIYLVAMSALSLHLYHGSWSLFQTLGIDSPGLNPAIRQGAKLLSFIVFIGFLSVPIASYFGFLPL